MKHIITYLEYTKENYDKEYPADGELGEEVFRGKVKKETIESSDCKEAHCLVLERMKKEGWELYSWNALIKDGIVRSGFSVCSADDPRHSYGYDIKNVITKIAENARKEYFEPSNEPEIKSIDMGLNTEPDFIKADDIIKRWVAQNNQEMVAYWEKAKTDSEALRDKIIQIVESEGRVSLTWSCIGETRFRMHASQWAEALPQYYFKISRYTCVVYKNKELAEK